MNKPIILVLTSLITILFLMISCEKSTKSNDNEAPRMSNISFNRGDTLVYVTRTSTGTDPLGNPTFENKKEIWAVNDQNEAGTIMDTIVLGHHVFFSGRFEDNSKLSTCKIVVKMEVNDTIHIPAYDENGDPATPDFTVMQLDTTIYLVDTYSMQNRTDSVFVMEKGVKTIDSVTFMRKGDESTASINRKMGIKNGVRKVAVACLDKAGNESLDSISIYFATRKELLTTRGK